MRILPAIAVTAMVATVACGSEASSTARLLHDRLRPGMTVDQVLEEAHAVYSAHPRAWMFCSVWGTPVPVAHDQVHDAARMEAAIDGLTWGSEIPDAAARREAAQRLKAARQIWFTMRGFGYLHLALTLDGSGRVETVSEVSGHAS